MTFIYYIRIVYLYRFSIIGNNISNYSTIGNRFFYTEKPLKILFLRDKESISNYLTIGNDISVYSTIGNRFL